MSTTPSQQPTAPQPEKSTDATKQSGLKPLSIEHVANNRVRVEFRIEDLVRRLIDPVALSYRGWHDWSGCSTKLLGVQLVVAVVRRGRTAWHFKLALDERRPKGTFALFHC